MSSTTANDPWAQIESLTGLTVPTWVKTGCIVPKLVRIPAGRELFAAGPASKQSMEWGAFEELDVEWYLRGNQLDPSWYQAAEDGSVAIYQFAVVIASPTPAVMSKVADQPGAPPRLGPPKYQYYSPAGLGNPVKKHLLGHLRRDGSFIHATITT